MMFPVVKNILADKSKRLMCIVGLFPPISSRLLMGGLFSSYQIDNLYFAQKV